MYELELVLGLLVAVTALTSVARGINIPYPILLVLGGLALGFVPGLPHIDLEPDLVFLLFLPPLLFVAGFYSSIRDLRQNARPIAQLAAGLVVFTSCLVAVVAHMLMPELGWAAAFALGGIVSPTDAVAATAIAQRLGAPRRIVTILEGESLVNDATGLVIYRAAVAAAVTGAFSLGETGVRFAAMAVGGVVVGLIVGWIVAWAWARLHDYTTTIAISLLVPFASYIPAEELGLSGVLAAVTAGVYLGRRSSRLQDPETGSNARLQGGAIWEMLAFLFNGLVFLLIGLQLPGIVGRLGNRSIWELIGLGVILSLTVILARLVWVFPNTYLPRMLNRALRERDPSPPWTWPLVLSWAGMRGVVSLAAALALPLQTADGSPFPGRDLIIFLTFVVILVTLVGQGLTLPWLIRRLCVRDDGAAGVEEAVARAAASEAAVARIEALGEEWPTHKELIDNLRAQYGHRSRHVGPQDGEVDGEAEQELLEHRMIRHEVIDAEREAVIGLRDSGVINDEVLRRIERELDLEEIRMEA